MTLRRIVDAAAATATMGLVSIGGWYGYTYFDQQRKMNTVSEELRRFHQVLSFQAASGQTDVSSRGWPTTIHPAWFGDAPPQNPLVSADRPWVEIAPIEHAHLADPPVRLALDRSLAMFWYNPYQGVVRARVPMQISDHRSLSLYNAANGTSLATLYHTEQPSTIINSPGRGKDDGTSDGQQSVEAPTESR